MQKFPDLIRLYRLPLSNATAKEKPRVSELKSRLESPELEFAQHLKIFQEFNKLRWPPLIIHENTNCFNIWKCQAIAYVAERTVPMYSFMHWLSAEFAYAIVLPGNILSSDKHLENFVIPGAWSRFSVVRLKTANDTESNLNRLWFDQPDCNKTISVGNLEAPGMLPSRRECVYVEAGDMNSAGKHQKFIFDQHGAYQLEAQERIKAEQLGRGLISASFWELTINTDTRFFAYECGGYGQADWLEIIARKTGLRTARIVGFDHLEVSSGEIMTIDQCKFKQVDEEASG